MSAPKKLDLRPGEWVEVRGAEEILATLGDDGTLDHLPFMPEMLGYCGRRFQVYKRADKTCDTVDWTGLRRMENTVHLSGLRCNGSAHDGCQAGCLLFWKEQWLRRAGKPDNAGSSNGVVPRRDRTWLDATTRREQVGGEACYRCQATELKVASRPLPWWEPRQYVRDVCKNRVSLGDVARGVAIAAINKVWWKLTGRRLPNVAGTLTKTPTETLGLQPGDWVVVKSKEEILKTLDRRGRNRGLSFDSEMIPYCGRRFRVLRQVEKLIDESSGQMIHPAGVCVILENVVCLARYRRSCPRSIFPYWREIWLRRAEAPAPGSCPLSGGESDAGSGCPMESVPTSGDVSCAS